ncbi:putative Alcohol dehydrogenase [Seiridium unicorne]|uniref:Alcohol dehydrogenase n=1 Tax=Seiridium unicorne TaxID=138068 RepID=A0ABR2UNF9_9PEZI
MTTKSPTKPQPKMRAVVWEGKPFHMVVKDVSKPTIQRPEDAIVRITTAAICGTDIHTYHGIFGSTKAPWIMGHEAIGVIEEVGSAVNFLSRGDRVIVPDFGDDGHLETHGSLVLNFTAVGMGEDFGSNQGCQSEFIKIPFADETLIKIPDKPSDDLEYLFMSDIWATAWGCLDFSGFQPGDSVAVFGAGPVGLLCAYSALLRGASQVFSIDHVQARLDKADSIGAIPIDFTKGSPTDQILKFAPDGVMRSCDCCGFECLNGDLKPQENFIISEAVKVTQASGGIGIIGVYASFPNSSGIPRGATMPANISFPIAEWWIKGQSIRGGGVDPRPIIPKLLALVQAGRAKPSFIVSSEIGLEDVPDGYKAFDRKEETKIVIRLPWEWEAENGERDGKRVSTETDGILNIRTRLGGASTLSLGFSFSGLADQFLAKAEFRNAKLTEVPSLNLAADVFLRLCKGSHFEDLRSEHITIAKSSRLGRVRAPRSEVRQLQCSPARTTPPAVNAARRQRLTEQISTAARASPHRQEQRAPGIVPVGEATGGVSEASELSEMDLLLLESLQVPVRTILKQAQIDFCIDQFQSFIPQLVQQNQLPFIHPASYQDAPPVVYQDLLGLSAMYCQKSLQNRAVIFSMLDSRIDSLVNSSKTSSWSTKDYLVGVQALIMYQIIRLFDGDIRQRANAERQSGTLEDWTLHLQSSINLLYEDCSNESLYKCWIFVESARRTILMSILLQALYSSLKDGFCTSVPRMANLPVTVNGALWSVPEETWWQFTLGSGGDLMTYHDFTVKWNEGQPLYTDIYETILLAACIPTLARPPILMPV